MKRGNIGRILMKNLQLTVLMLFMMTGTATAGTYHVLSDHLGTPQVVIDKNEEVVWKADYEPFGKATVDEDPDGDGQTVTNNIRFPGQYYDEETGLHDNGWRTYDPGRGGYIQSDPIGLHGGLNTYLYATANPVRFIDPQGLQPVPITPAGGLTCIGNICTPGAIFPQIEAEAKAIGCLLECSAVCIGEFLGIKAIELEAEELVEKGTKKIAKKALKEGVEKFAEKAFLVLNVGNFASSLTCLVSCGKQQ